MTLPTGVIDIRKCSDEELKTMLDEAREASKHSRKLGRVMGIVAAHRLKHTREFLMYEELAIWRRMDGFDRVAEDEESCFHGHRLLEYAASLWFEVNALKDAISMPRQKVSKLINAIEQGKLSDEEYAILKRLVKKRDREAAQVTAVKRDDTVQHCSPIPQTPEPPSVVYFNLENEERMELDELKSSSAGTGLAAPGQQCPPYERIWEQRRTIPNGVLTAAVDSNQGGRIPSPTESVDTRADKSTRILADTTFLQQGHKTFSEQNKQFDPGGSREKAPLWNAAVTLPSFSGEKLGGFLSIFYLCSVYALCVFVFQNYVFPQVITSQRS